MMRTWVLFGVVLVGLGCGDDDAPIMDSDAGCTRDVDCSDGVFCNGQEVCTMGLCGPGTPPCDEEACDETGRVCTSGCLTPDADGDGVASLACGGDDCADDDPDRFPGNPEVCDADGHDEDCDPTTVGDVDVDGDGHISAACCNGTTCGDDCADRLADVFAGATETCDLRDQDCDGNVDEGVSVMLFEDLDGDLYGDSRTLVACAGMARTSTTDIDCDNGVPTRHGAQLEACDGRDNDCDEAIDEDTVNLPWYPDTDGDGFGDPEADPVISCAPVDGHSLLPLDCDDANGDLYPAKAELCNGRDDNCDGVAGFVITPGDTEDDDRDGYADATCGGDDCDDEDPYNHPGGIELCDGLDNDCDGMADEAATDVDWYLDADRDGYGDPGDVVSSCERQVGRVLRGGDCADANPVIHPGMVERCNGVDDDCDGTVDEGGLEGVRGFRDADGDGYGDSAMGTFSCGTELPSGYVALPGDCNDGDADVKPLAPDTCNGVDDDCDGLLDEDGVIVWYADGDRDGVGGATVIATQCNRPSATAVDGTGDCDDANPAIAPGTMEDCDGVDQDCDGRADEGAPLMNLYPDGDGDGFAPDGAPATMACGPGAGFVTARGDCDDTASAVNPDADESCNGVDDDCNGMVDDGLTSNLCDGAANATGACLPPPAATGTCECTDSALYADCDLAPFNGCESELATDAANCGACGNACAAGERCMGSTCVPSQILSLNGGVAFQCALRDTGEAWCFGSDQEGHMGQNRAFAVRSTYVSAASDRVVAMSDSTFSTNGHGCLITERTDGGRDMVCFGHDQSGQLGIGYVQFSGSIDTATPIVPAVDAMVDDWVQVDTDGGNFTIALTASGDVWTWGYNGNNYAGRLGRDTGYADDPTPGLVTLLPGPAVDVAGGPIAGCAVLADGRVYCWGGIGSTGQSATGGGSADTSGFTPQPVRTIVGGVEVDLDDVVEVDLHNTGGCARQSAAAGGGVYCWGEGAIGNGATSSGLATRVSTVAASTSLSCGTRACCATAGTNVLCWGNNDQGQLGRGVISASEPVADFVVLESGANLSGVVEVSAASTSFCARTTDQRVVCWGNGGHQIGSEDYTDRPHAGAPTYVTGI